MSQELNRITDDHKVELFQKPRPEWSDRDQDDLFMRIELTEPPLNTDVASWWIFNLSTGAWDAIKEPSMAYTALELEYKVYHS